MVEKLENGQTFMTVRGRLVTIKEHVTTPPYLFKSTQATFLINSDFGWYYGDGPLIGKWHLGSRTAVGPGENPHDLIIPEDEPVLEQMDLFDWENND